MGTPPYDDPDTLALMRADAREVELAGSVGGSLDGSRLEGPRTAPAESAVAADDRAGWFEVPADAVALGEVHFYLE